VQIVQSLQPDDGLQRASVATEILRRIYEDSDYLKRVCFFFLDEATFHTSDVVNGHNVHIWGSEKPHVDFQNQQSSPKVNVWCGLTHNKVILIFRPCNSLLFVILTK